jgi:hypothetical protein
MNQSQSSLDHQNIAEILLKVALNTKTHNPDFDNNKKYFENLATCI